MNSRSINIPLVNILILKSKSHDYIQAIADDVNSDVIETLGLPLGDRYS